MMRSWCLLALNNLAGVSIYLLHCNFLQKGTVVIVIPNNLRLVSISVLSYQFFQNLK